MNAVDTFHQIVGQLSYPMAIVTAASRGQRGGCLVGFHTQCSIDPPRYLVCISRRNHTATVAADGAHLAVHLLDRADHDLAVLFGEQTGDDTDKFADVGWSEKYGVPVLDRSRAWFVGKILHRYNIDDHHGYVLEPVSADLAGPVTQLSFPEVQDMEPGHEA